MYELSEEAAGDFAAILAYSIDHYGAITARRLESRLTAKLESIASGISPGHLRRDVADVPLRFVTERPFVIAFDPATRRMSAFSMELAILLVLSAKANYSRRASM